MKSEFSSTFFAANRRKLRELVASTAPIVITANGQLQRGGDSVFPFQQDASFWYLTGVDESDVILVMDKDKEYLVVPFREGVRAAFDGSVETEALSEKSGIQTVLSEEEGWRKLNDALRRTKKVATMAAPPRYIDVYGMYTNPARKRLTSRLKAQYAQMEFIDVGEHLVRLRMTKQPEELRTLQKAIDITIASVSHAVKTTERSKYLYEYEIEAELARGFRVRGARGHAFDPIVAGGKNATTIHYLENNSRLSKNELVVLDIGAEFDHYAADITRTMAVSTPSSRQKQVLDAVEAVQAYGFSLLKPGVILKDYEEEIERFMGEKLIELGLITVNDTESVRQYYPHAASHHLGLNVHDVGDRLAPLAANMVITVEPGIYIPEEGIGVRIEDDVVLTDTGIRVLSDALPTRLD